MPDPSEMHEPAAAYGAPVETAGPLPGTQASRTVPHAAADNAPAEAANRSPGAAHPEPWSHPWHDQLGLLYHRAIAGKIRQQPALLEIAKENLGRWLAAEPDATPSQARREWQRILETGSVDEILCRLTDPSEAGHRRRQSSPFAGILTPEERRAVRDAML